MFIRYNQTTHIYEYESAPNTWSPLPLDAAILNEGTVNLARISGLTNTQIASGAAIAWDKISKAGSSLADLETRAGSDLVVPWTAVAYGDVTFSASGSMTWTVESGDFISYRYARIGKVIHSKGVIIATSVGGTLSNELRISAPPGMTFGGTDSFGFCIYTENSFSSQTIGQAIARVSGNFIAIRKADASNWASTTNATGIIFSNTAELA